MNEPTFTDPTERANLFEGLLFALLRDLGTLLSGMGSASAAQQALLEQRSLATERPTVLTVAEVSEAWRRGAVDDAQLANTLARLGYSDTAQGAIRAIAEQLADIGSLVALRRRGTIDESTYVSRADVLGYSPDVAAWLYSLSEYVPPAQDVVQFAVREVFTPEVAQRFGQYEDFPAEALPFFERAGVSKADAERYWAAHWTLPSIQMVFDMYHRRDETGVTLDDVMMLLRAQDVMPFWREKIVAVATSPYTRVDVRRMHKLGILTDAQVESAYKELGYSDERAHNLMLFTIEVNKGEKDAELEPFRSSLKSRVTSMFQSRTLPEKDARDALHGLGYSDAEVEAYIAEAHFVREADLADDMRKGIQKNYVSGFWTRDTVITKMHELGFSDDEIVDTVSVWDVLRETHEATAEERAQKDLTKTEVITAYREALMPEPEAVSALRMLGYDDDETDMLLRLADAANAKAVRTDTEAGVRALYIAGRVSEASARDRLAAAGVTATRVDSLIGKWQDELRARTPSLTVAQITAALKAGLIDEPDADRRLTALGYSMDDRAIIIALAL